MELDRFQMDEFDDQFGQSFLLHQDTLAYVHNLHSRERAQAQAEVMIPQSLLQIVNISDLEIFNPPAGFFTFENRLKGFSRQTLTQRKRGINSRNSTVWTFSIGGQDMIQTAGNLTNNAMVAYYKAIKNIEQPRYNWNTLNDMLINGTLRGLALNQHYGLLVGTVGRQTSIIVVGLNGPIGYGALGGNRLNLFPPLEYMRDSVAEAISQRIDGGVQLHVRR